MQAQDLCVFLLKEKYALGKLYVFLPADFSRGTHCPTTVCWKYITPWPEKKNHSSHGEAGKVACMSVAWQSMIIVISAMPGDGGVWHRPRAISPCGYALTYVRNITWYWRQNHPARPWKRWRIPVHWTSGLLTPCTKMSGRLSVLPPTLSRERHNPSPTLSDDRKRNC